MAVKISKIWKDSNECIALFQSENLQTFTNIISQCDRINAGINCSTFTTAYPIGRNQGNLFDNRPEEANVYSVVIFKDDTYKWGILHSWEYTREDYPTITAGFSPQAIMIGDGKRINKMSTGMYDSSKLTKVASCVMMGKVKNGKWGFFYSPSTTAMAMANELQKQHDLEFLCLLDGGGSSNMYLNGKYITKTSRKMWNALTMCEKTPDPIPVPKPIDKDGILAELDLIIKSAEAIRGKL